MKIMLVAAMPTESLDIIDKFGMMEVGKLANFYPHYYVKFQDREVILLQTYVGSINTPAATALAIEKLKPEYVIKVGCVGGNAPGVKANDIIVPSLFFHSGAWVTRSIVDNMPTGDSSVWQSLYGDNPYQNNKENLGGLDLVFYPDKNLTEKYKNVLVTERLSFIEAPLGGGDMVIFSHNFMDNIRKNILKSDDDANLKWCTDNESYSIAQICQVHDVPFTGVYFVASSDYEDMDGYNPNNIRKQTRDIILPIVEKLVLKL